MPRGIKFHEDGACGKSITKESLIWNILFKKKKKGLSIDVNNPLFLADARFQSTKKPKCPLLREKPRHRAIVSSRIADIERTKPDVLNAEAEIGRVREVAISIRRVFVARAVDP